MPSDSWLLGSLFTYAKYPDLLNILLRALQRSFRTLKILVCVPSDLQNEGRINSSCSPTLMFLRASSNDPKQHIFSFNSCAKLLQKRYKVSDSKRCQLNTADLPDVFKSPAAALAEPSYPGLHLTQNAVMPLIGLVSATDCK